MIDQEKHLLEVFRKNIPGLLKRVGEDLLFTRKQIFLVKSDIQEMYGAAGIDIQIQKKIISAIMETDLRKCMIIAEEESRLINPSIKDFLISIDPIDGSRAYYKKPDSKKFQIIVQLKSKFGFIATAIYYPAYNEMLLIEYNKITQGNNLIKPLPKKDQLNSVATKDPLSAKAKLYFKQNNLHSIVYHGDPKIPGYLLFAKKKYKGFYKKEINTSDGFVWAHIAIALGGKAIDIKSNKVIGKSFDFFNFHKKGRHYYYNCEYISII